MYKIEVSMDKIELEIKGGYNSKHVETNLIAANKLREVLTENDDDSCEYTITWDGGHVEILNSGMFAVDWEDLEIYGFIK